jgi:hypothetical protein
MGPGPRARSSNGGRRRLIERRRLNDGAKILQKLGVAGGEKALDLASDNLFYSDI